MCGIEQRARQHRQAVAQAGLRFRIAGIFRRHGMQRAGRCGAGRDIRCSSRYSTRLSSKNSDRHALERAQVVGDLRRGPAPVADDVGQHGAVAVDAA